jgi:hypothetical protein
MQPYARDPLRHPPHRTKSQCAKRAQAPAAASMAGHAPPSEGGRAPHETGAGVRERTWPHCTSRRGTRAVGCIQECPRLSIAKLRAVSEPDITRAPLCRPARIVAADTIISHMNTQATAPRLLAARRTASRAAASRGGPTQQMSVPKAADGTLHLVVRFCQEMHQSALFWRHCVPSSGRRQRPRPTQARLINLMPRQATDAVILAPRRRSRPAIRAMPRPNRIVSMTNPAPAMAERILAASQCGDRSRAPLWPPKLRNAHVLLQRAYCSTSRGSSLRRSA